MRNHLATRLKRAGRYADLRRLADYASPPVPQAANDNLPGGFGADLILEVRPSPDEMLRLALRDAIAARAYGPVSQADIDLATRQRIRFKDGRIDQWLGGDNRWHSAEPHYRQERGKRRKSEEEVREDAARYLALRGTTMPETGYRTASAAYRPLNDNGRLLHGLGVSGFYTFAQAWVNAGLSPASRIPRYMVGIARGCAFMAGRVRRNVTASPGSFVGAPDAVENAIVAALDAPRVAAALGEHHAVLEASLDGATAREIAAGKGWTGKAGERKAVALQDEALKTLAKLAA